MSAFQRKAFDRHEILRAHYRKQISAWDWKHIVDDLDTRCKDECEEGDDEFYAHYWLGSVYCLMPSGKCYAPWTTNQTRADVTKDAAFIEALQDVADEHKCFVSSPMFADSDQMFVGKEVFFDGSEEDECDGD